LNYFTKAVRIISNVPDLIVLAKESDKRLIIVKTLMAKNLEDILLLHGIRMAPIILITPENK
jgi:hypothetical protein